ncbi:NADP-dependent malic enzyme 3 [Arabidopsis lyrata subsp. lyrata]|uniref:NADP-dependent malic enzyme 3 n=1 Tax=Arabidopsis lyrata subsp. lyrata TaxID=81972 RepID=UPI000A29C9C8|nr:NADP-dependent malic enzyme 3 [Arabidopsis lyrata subsp. lyrata]|eukprot:XP_020876140.1 NADP-dependent malic enzyme 3 [Arabidopsis lyrata subsp. lyrata]
MGTDQTQISDEYVSGNKSGVGGGISDVYGEDSATLDQLVTPWVTSVASGYTLMRDPRYNKGLAFTDKERDTHYITGLLPPVVLSQDVQERKYYSWFQFEDFANHHAFELLSKYCSSHLVFNDDIQGTASVVLAGLIAAQKVLGKSLADHTFLFLGAGEAGTGIAELIALKISRETGKPIDETRKKIWLVDSKGLIVSSRKESLQHFKQPWAHDHKPVKELLGAVNAIKPTVLIGTSGVGKTFTKEVVEAMATLNEKPLILALSNPTSQAECTAEEAYTWTKGRAIFASGSPFDPVEYDGKKFMPGQANNCYIFPGLGLGLIMSGAIRVRDDMLLAASEALASQVTEENFANGLIYPPFANIRKISANIAASVGAKTYELGLASNLPRPKDLVKMAESCMYSPVYRNFR